MHDLHRAACKILFAVCKLLASWKEEKLESVAQGVLAVYKLDTVYREGREEEEKRVEQRGGCRFLHLSCEP